MRQLIIVLISLLGCAHYVNSECANACNGHGKCTSYDMCICNRNWQASDCSERVCMFGLAHVDTPKVTIIMLITNSALYHSFFATRVTWMLLEG